MLNIMKHVRDKYFEIKAEMSETSLKEAKLLDKNKFINRLKIKNNDLITFKKFKVKDVLASQKKFDEFLNNMKKEIDSLTEQNSKDYDNYVITKGLSKNIFKITAAFQKYKISSMALKKKNKQVNGMISLAKKVGLNADYFKKLNLESDLAEDLELAQDLVEEEAVIETEVVNETNLETTKPIENENLGFYFPENPTTYTISLGENKEQDTTKEELPSTEEKEVDKNSNELEEKGRIQGELNAKADVENDRYRRPPEPSDVDDYHKFYNAAYKEAYESTYKQELEKQRIESSKAKEEQKNSLSDTDEQDLTEVRDEQKIAESKANILRELNSFAAQIENETVIPVLTAAKQEELSNFEVNIAKQEESIPNNKRVLLEENQKVVAETFLKFLLVNQSLRTKLLQYQKDNRDFFEINLVEYDVANVELYLNPEFLKNITQENFNLKKTLDDLYQEKQIKEADKEKEQHINNEIGLANEFINEISTNKDLSDEEKQSVISDFEKDINILNSKLETRNYSSPLYEPIQTVESSTIPSEVVQPIQEHIVSNDEFTPKFELDSDNLNKIDWMNNPTNHVDSEFNTILQTSLKPENSDEFGRTR